MSRTLGSIIASMLIGASLLFTGSAAVAGAAVPNANATGINVQLPATTKTTYSITGVVRRQSDLTAVAGVSVSVFGDGNSQGTTDANGKYTVGHLLPGDYHVAFAPYGAQLNLVGGYLGADAPDHYSKSYPGVTVTITNHDVTRNANLPSGHHIKGRIDNGNGEVGIASVSVLVSSPTFQASAETDQDGYFTLEGVPNGSYKFYVYAPTGSNYQTGCYWHHGNAPDNFSPNCAQHTSLTIADSDIRLVLMRLPIGLTVRGHIRDRSGDPIKDARVSTYSSAGGSDSDGATTDTSGAYVIHGVTPGSYVLGVSGPVNSMYLSGEYDKADATNHWTTEVSKASVIKVAANVNLPVIRPALGFSVSGKISTTSNAGVSGAVVSVYDPSTGRYAQNSTDANGSYRLGPLPAGHYMIRVTPASAQGDLQKGYFRAKVANNFTPHSARATLVPVSGNVSGKNVRLPLGASISGRVTVHGQSYATTLSITVDGMAVGAYSDATTGKYTFRGVPAGRYLVAVYGSTSYPTASTVSETKMGYYKADAPGHFTADSTKATFVTVSP